MTLALKQPSCRTPPLVLAIVASLSWTASPKSPAYARTIQWSGYSWSVRDTGGATQGPGPNIFSNSTDNVFVDDSGDLHVKIRKAANGKWTASELDMNHSLTYGTYEWEVSSRYDQMAANAVGGLFTYLDPQAVANQTGGAIGNGIPDTPHEIDVEFTRAWGSGNLYFTTQDPDVTGPSTNFYQALTGDFTTHRFTWAPGRIEWDSYNGHVAGVASPGSPIVEQRSGSNHEKPAQFIYTGPVIPKDLNEIPIINFWLSSNNASVDGPTSGAEQELVIHSFTFTPLADSADFNRDGAVDGQDFLIWQRGFGQGTTQPTGDANHNVVVDGADLAIWTTQFTQGAAASINEVAEPSSAAILALGAFVIWRLFM